MVVCTRCKKRISDHKYCDFCLAVKVAENILEDFRYREKYMTTPRKKKEVKAKEEKSNIPAPTKCSNCGLARRSMIHTGKPVIALCKPCYDEKYKGRSNPC